MEKYKFLEHTADIKFQAFGNSLEEAFFNSFYALKEVMTENKIIKSSIKKKIKIKGNDLKSLLYNFLEEALFLFDAKDFVISEIKDIKIDLNKFSLKAEVIGNKASNYKISNNVKAITYNDMEIIEDKKNKKFIIQVVLDV